MRQALAFHLLILLITAMFIWLNVRFTNQLSEQTKRFACQTDLECYGHGGYEIVGK